MRKTLYIVLVFSLFPFVAEANDGAFSIGPQGGTIYPENNEHIEMLEEEVVYDEATGQFITIFLFRNTSGEAQSVIIGFPVAPSEDSEDEYSENPPTDNELMDEIKNTFKFQTWVDGKYISRELWKIGKGNRYKFAFTTTVIFKPNQTIKIINKFKQGFGYGGDNMGGSFSSIRYILRTGAYWKGNIGKAKIIFKLANPHNLIPQTDTIYRNINSEYVSLTKEKYYWQSFKNPTSVDTINRIITWEFLDFEPDFDIDLTFITGYEGVLDTEFIYYIDSLSACIINKDTICFNKFYTLADKYIYKNQNKGVYERVYKDFAGVLLNSTEKTDSISVHYKVRHRINAFAALNNYEFSNPMWAKIFELFDWYKPETKTPDYSPEIQSLIEKLTAYEKEKQYITEVVIQNETNNKNTEFKDVVFQENDSFSETEIESRNNIRLISFIFGLLILIGSVIYLLKKKKT